MSSVVLPATPDYNRIFDRSIYDQTEYYSKESVTESGLIEHFRNKKLEQLIKSKLAPYEKEAQYLDKNYGITTPEGNAKHFGVDPLKLLYPLAKSLINLQNQYIGNFMNVWDQERLPISREEAKKQYHDLRFAIQVWKEGIEKESVWDLEVKYILQKRNISSLRMQERIENDLLEARGQFGDYKKTIIEKALLIPCAPLYICNPEYKALDRVITDRRLKNYNVDVQDTLTNFAMKLINASRTEAGSLQYTRYFLYLYGNPGCGKSTAAQMIVESLGLPYHTISLTSPDDLSKIKVQGQPFTQNANDPGLLALALMSRDKCFNKSFQNAVLIINDFDYILFSNEGANIAMNFALENLDPDKKHYYNPFFDADIDVSRLSIIITANKRIPQRPEDPNVQDPYAALRSRVKEIHFPDFPLETIKPLLVSVTEEYAINAKIPSAVIEANKESWIERVVQAQGGQTIDLRKFHESVNEIVTRISVHNERQRIAWENKYIIPAKKAFSSIVLITKTIGTVAYRVINLSATVILSVGRKWKQM